MSLPNLAGVNPYEADAVCRQELETAGICAMTHTSVFPGEVETRVFGEFGPWTLKRYWRYWVVKCGRGLGIPPKAAKRLNDTWGRDCRAAGFAGGLDDAGLAQWQSLDDTQDTYHIDTQEALWAWALAVGCSQVKRGRDVERAWEGLDGDAKIDMLPRGL